MESHHEVLPGTGGTFIKLPVGGHTNHRAQRGPLRPLSCLTLSSVILFSTPAQAPPSDTSLQGSSHSTLPCSKPPLPPFPHWRKVLYAGAFQNILGLAGTHCALSLNLLTLHISYSQSHVATWFHYLWEELSPGLAHRGPGGSTVGRDIRLMSHRILSLGCHWSPLAISDSHLKTHFSLHLLQEACLDAHRSRPV